MLDPQTYRASESLAKSLVPNWRISQTHNVDHFERAGFPVRIGSIRELGQIIDTMQENRFDGYMRELGGLTDEEYQLTLQACVDAVLFQLIYLPHRPPVLPISTLLSALALYGKLRGIARDFRSVLEIGPGCGYVSFFLKRHAALENYSQIEACESFYILQNLVNLYCFGPRFEERALPPSNMPAARFFVDPRPDLELSPTVKTGNKLPRCLHYPWWRIGELAGNTPLFDIVMSNANLLEFSPSALNDYLALLGRALKPDGVFLVQCTGYPAHGTVDQLLQVMHAKGFAQLIFVNEHVPYKFPAEAASGLGDREVVDFTTNNAAFVRRGHPLFDKYYDRKNCHPHFISPEPLVRSTFFDRPHGRQSRTLQQFLKDTEQALVNEL
jgi:SAM-dependent methyltransferase